MNNTDTRTTLNLPAEMAAAIDTYWHTEKLNSRNAAIRELLRRALNEVLKAKPAKEPRR